MLKWFGINFLLRTRSLAGNIFLKKIIYNSMLLLQIQASKYTSTKITEIWDTDLLVASANASLILVISSIPSARFDVEVKLPRVPNIEFLAKTQLFYLAVETNIAALY
uniref:Uncharacterized protein n=1 Tax=Micrurus lemniscatus lemniscatus TaxID=129467 RepID=A0A2D4IWS3_MICLE